MNDFRERLAQFRGGMNAEAARSAAPSLRALLARERHARRRRWRWAVTASAVLALCLIPAYRDRARRQREAAQAQADAALLEHVSQGLARPVARAMAPLLGIGGGDAELVPVSLREPKERVQRN